MLQIRRFHRLILPLSILFYLGCTTEIGSDENQSDTSSHRDRLKVLLTSQPQGLDYLPRSGTAESDEFRLLSLYAEARGLDIEKIYVDEFSKLIPALQSGDGEVIVNNLTVTESRKGQVNFTSPITYIHEQLVGRKGDTPKGAQQMEGRAVAVHRSAAYYETLKNLQQRRYQPPFEIIEVDEAISTDTIIKGVEEGTYDLAVVDSNLLRTLPEGNSIEIGFDIGVVRPVAWAVSKENSSRLDDLNDFLARHYLGADGDFISRGDLKTIKENKVLRVLTRNSSSTYYLWRGELHGFEYELAKRFADNHDLRIEMVVPPSRDLLIPWLEQGKGDLIAASMSITEDRQQKAIAFSRPYNTISEHIVSRHDDPISEVAQLNGRTVVVRRSSSYWQSLKTLQREGIKFKLIAAPEELETEELIDKVASGEFDLTAADSHILDIELTWRNDIRPAFPLQERQHGWIVRIKNPQLLKAINAFHKKEHRGLFYNVTYRKYFENSKRIQRHREERADTPANNTLSPYDELTKKHADHYGFDWRLIVSQMYQESRFNPMAKSWVGAQGLMQVMPRTGKEIGITRLHDPDMGIKAGVYYLNWLLHRFEPELDTGERTWFALAAYNAGIGHVRDARRLATKKGWNPDIWFDHVEKAMLLLAKKEYAKSAKHGYVRGEEPVAYVRQIRDRYLAYIELQDHNHIAMADWIIDAADVLPTQPMLPPVTE
ncbi:MAG: transporter substrate-binding domain-containing protein [Chromatiales bacterium]|nr:transporter substrate-binding domain-containing protein [Chromatiales bacterium]